MGGQQDSAVQPWYHGPITREEAEQLLSSGLQQNSTAQSRSYDGESMLFTLWGSYYSANWNVQQLLNSHFVSYSAKWRHCNQNYQTKPMRLQLMENLQVYCD